MKAEKILETALYVTDLEAAEVFYTSVLGLKIHSKEPGRHIFLYCGSSMLLLFNPARTINSSGKVPSHGTTGPGHVAFSIEPDSFDQWREHLKHQGVAIESEMDWPQGGHSIYFRDPSGNSIELTTPQIWGL